MIRGIAQNAQKRYFQICRMRQGGNGALPFLDCRFRGDDIRQRGDEGIPVKFAVPQVNLGYCLFQLVHIPLRQASHDGDFAYVAAFLHLGELKQHIDGLLLGIANEPAGVDDYIFPGRGLRVVAHRVPFGGKAAQQPFRVNQVFGAAQGDYVYPVVNERHFG